MATNLAKSSVEIRLRVKSIATALFADEIAHQISAKVGIRAEYIDIYPVRGGWDASLRRVTGIWAKSADVKQAARAFQAVYTLKKTIRLVAFSPPASSPFRAPRD